MTVEEVLENEDNVAGSKKGQNIGADDKKYALLREDFSSDPYAEIRKLLMDKIPRKEWSKSQMALFETFCEEGCPAPAGNRYATYLLPDGRLRLRNLGSKHFTACSVVQKEFLPLLIEWARRPAKEYSF